MGMGFYPCHSYRDFVEMKYRLQPTDSPQFSTSLPGIMVSSIVGSAMALVWSLLALQLHSDRMDSQGIGGLSSSRSSLLP